MGVLIGDDEKAVGMGKCNKIARSLHGNLGDAWQLTIGRRKGADGRQEAGEAGLEAAAVVLREPGEGETGAMRAAARERRQHWRGKKLKCDGGGDWIAGQAKEGEPRHLAEYERLAALFAPP